MMWCSSQNTHPKLVNDSLIVITPTQLKQTNLIFLEHKKLKLELPELSKQVITYKNVIASYEQSDSIRQAQIKRLMLHTESCEQVINNQFDKITKLESRNKLYKGLTIGGFSVGAALLIVLMMR